MPDRAVAGLADRRFGKLLLRRLEFLQADDVGLGLGEPAQQHGKAAVDAVDVEGRDPHAELPSVIPNRVAPGIFISPR